MLCFRCLVPTLLLLLCSLLSCSSDSAYPYTLLKGDPYKTRIYTLPGGVKLYIAATDECPRVEAALCMSFVAGDTLATLYKESVYSPEYPLLFASMGTQVSSVAESCGATLVYNNIPSNELENWAVMMQGTFATLPDTLSILLFGDVVYDDAVVTLSRYFSGSSAPCVDDASLVAFVRDKYCDKSDDSQMLVTFSQARADAKNSIELLEPSPAKVLFPDCDKLKIKESSGQPRMVVAASSDSLFSFAVRARLQELPASFLVLLKNYFDAYLQAENDSLASATQVKIEKNSRVVEFSISGSAANMKELVAAALERWKSLADGNSFYKYLLTNSRDVVSTKKDYENIAMQVVSYANGGERLCGLRELAEYSMNELFTTSGEILFCGEEADKAYSLYLNALRRSMAFCKSDYSYLGDTVPRYMFLPADTVSIATISLGGSYASVEDLVAMALFNKAAMLSAEEPLMFFCPGGALFSAGGRMPFTRKAFEAAKSFLLYDCSTHGSDGLSLIDEYTSSAVRGYTSSQLYDALFGLSFSDIEELYNHHVATSTSQIIIGRESDLDMHELASRGRVVLLTHDELFGY